ncbi:rhodanese-like domain-containing protein [Luteibacter yeojuensis]|uniref:Rhodanese-like domain-containing protein n=1 Tax=Luteibacter yeojuensis TaxID=345309 RepID=A0A7X5TQT4_9GAMM|nr:rhodanese-like domain-containing protein [Luteibacter yeojuensis]NID15812.1 rhodanese-like domain-containing protein [Luteibacter yeojuensis]
MNGFRASLLFAVLLWLPAAAWAGDESREDLASRMAGHEAPLLLDVRTPSEYRDGHLAGALNVPVDEVASRHGVLGIPRDRELVVYCKSGKRAARARATLESLGYSNVRLLEGSADAWRAEGRPLVHEEPSSP